MLILYYTSIHRETLWGLCYKQAGRDLPWTCRLRCSKIIMLEYGSALHTFWECCVQRSYFCVDTKTLFKQCLISAIMNTSWYFTVFLTTPPMFASVAKRGVVANALLILMKLNWVTSTNNIMKLLKLRCDSSVTLSINSPKRDSCCSERNERLHSSVV